LDHTADSDILILVGDFNARVGSCTNDDDRDIVGKFGVDQRNEAGDNLVEFCALNGLRIMNTVFKKRDRLKHTWQHPGTKNWHCIDYVMFRQTQSRKCTNVEVKRSAECWSDHKLLAAEIRLRATRKYRQLEQVPQKKLDVALLRSDTMEGCNARLAYEKALATEWKESQILGQGVTYLAMEKGILRAAETVLPPLIRRQPDWFRDNETELQKIIRERDICNQRWLQSGGLREHEEFKKARRAVVKAVRRAKNSWFRNMAEACQRAEHGEKWKIISQMKTCRDGMRPTRKVGVRKTDGLMCAGQNEVLERWREHFNKILNVPSIFRQDVTDNIKQEPVREWMRNPPSIEEIEAAMVKLKFKKAAGNNGILPEMVRCGGRVLAQWLADIVTKIWKEGGEIQAWKDAVMIPIPKKGDMSICDNWRGISLLDVVGKVFARVMQIRLQKVAEEVLPESQCGFRKGRGCTDMVFAIRQLVEKMREHRSKGFILFVDLTKAYDSVPRAVLWQVLHKIGIPEETVRMVQSLHEGMEAVVRVGNETTEKIQVNNGVRQGCTLAPTLFNLYLAAVIKQWREQCDELGITVKHNNNGGRLSDTRNQQSYVNCKITELQFADDAAAVVCTREGLEQATNLLIRITSEWGLTVSLKKTEFMVVGEHSDAEESPIMIPGQIQGINRVREFTYLGSRISEEGGVASEVSQRILKASKMFGALSQAVFMDRDLSRFIKSFVYRATVWNTLLYGSETWAVTQKEIRRLETFNNRCLRTLAGVTKRQQEADRITSQQIRDRCEVRWSVEEEIRARRLRWVGHVARMEENRIPKILLFSRLEKKRNPGGQKLRWKDRIQRDFKEVGIDSSKWYELAQDRNLWTSISLKRGKTGIQTEQMECGNCGQLCKGKGGLATHKRYCGGVRVVGDIRDIDGTVIAQEGEAWVRRCANCGIVVKTTAGMKRHKPVCGRTAVKKKRMTEKEREDLPTLHTCTICARKFSLEVNLQRHMKQKHPQLSSGASASCGCTVSNELHLATARRRHELI
jgi:hypothetical protein